MRLRFNENSSAHHYESFVERGKCLVTVLSCWKNDKKILELSLRNMEKVC